MCPSCETRCEDDLGHHDATHAEPFCTGLGTDMHMTGFAMHPTDCVILLFHEWKLDSAWAFGLGVLGTFAHILRSRPQG